MGAHRLRRVALNLAATPFFLLGAVSSVDLLALATVEQVWGPQPVLSEWLRSSEPWAWERGDKLGGVGTARLSAETAWAPLPPNRLAGAVVSARYFCAQ